MNPEIILSESRDFKPGIFSTSRLPVWNDTLLIRVRMPLCRFLFYTLFYTRKLRVFLLPTLIPWASVLDRILCNVQSCEYGGDSTHTDFVSVPTTLRALRAKSLHPCSSLCNSMDCSPPGSSAHGTLQVEILEGIAMSFSRGSSWPRDQTYISFISCIGR